MYTIRQVPQKSLFCYYYYFFLLFFDKLLDLKLFFSRVQRSWPLKCVNWTSERVTYQKFARKDGRTWEGRGQTYLSVSSFFIQWSACWALPTRSATKNIGGYYTYGAQNTNCS
jgi:hypothetical protein